MKADSHASVMQDAQDIPLRERAIALSRWEEITRLVNHVLTEQRGQRFGNINHANSSGRLRFLFLTTVLVEYAPVVDRRQQRLDLLERGRSELVRVEFGGVVALRII